MASESGADRFQEGRFGPMPGKRRQTHEVVEGLVRVPDVLVNAYLVGPRGASDGEWVLVDAGLRTAKRPILRAVSERFGAESRPAAIVLTHGHFDHVGALEDLAERWDVDVYAHPKEMPYLTGQDAYPPPDPSVEGGFMARTARLFPKGPIDLGARIEALPEDGSVPGLSGWRWIHTPGHTAGHVSLFRERDRVLVAGDAFVTVKQESAMAVLTQYKKVHGPPAYFTSDWLDAWESVRRLARLEPEVAATGHGLPMGGQRLRVQLNALARDFDRYAVPKSGRYVRLPAVADERGVHYVPPRPRRGAASKVLGALGVAAATGAAIAMWRRLS